MDNRRYFYLAEGECEEKLLEALQLKPSLIHQTCRRKPLPLGMGRNAALLSF